MLVGGMVWRKKAWYPESDCGCVQIRHTRRMTGTKVGLEDHVGVP